MRLTLSSTNSMIDLKLGYMKISVSFFILKSYKWTSYLGFWVLISLYGQGICKVYAWVWEPIGWLGLEFAYLLLVFRFYFNFHSQCLACIYVHSSVLLTYGPNSCPFRRFCTFFWVFKLKISSNMIFKNNKYLN